MKRLRPVLFYTVLLLLCLGSLSAQAATIYVSIQGNDARSCARAQNAQTPRRTLNAGIACLTGGDTLIVGGGVYDEVIANTGGGLPAGIPNGLSEQQRTVIKAAPGAHVLLKPITAYNENSNAVITMEGSYVTIDGLNIDKEKNGIWQGGYGIGLGGRHNIFQNLEIAHVGGQPVQGKTDHSQLLKLHIHHNGDYERGYYHPYRGFHHGIYIDGQFNLIEDCSIHDQADGYGVQLYASYSTVRRNLIVNNYAAGIYALGGFNLIDSNVLIRNGGGIQMKRGANKAYNNTLYDYDTSTTGYGIWTDAPTDIIKNNLVMKQQVNSEKPYIYVLDSGGTTRSGNLLELGVNPAYISNNMCDKATMYGCAIIETDITRIVIDATSGNLHLTANSPAIGAGVPAPDVAGDKVGRPRTGGMDVGAYQYGSQGAVVPAPQQVRVRVVQ